MPTNKDWLPTTRASVLEMVHAWNPLLTANYTRWKIPQSTVTELGLLTVAAEEALAAAQNESTRTPVITARCKATFDELIAAMRDLKKRYLYVPPLTNADLIALGLKPHDTNPTPSPTPSAQVTLETFLRGRHEFGIKIVYLTGSPDDIPDRGYRIYYQLVAPGETPPANPDDLHKSFYTQRHKDFMQFEFADSGKTAWMAVQVEKDGKKGPWGPLVAALIP